MVARGVLFALSSDQEAGVIERAGKHEALVNYIAESIEERWEEAWLAETDKAWDAMHRALGDDLFDHEFRSPLHGVILGGRLLTAADWFIVVHKTADQVRDIAAAAKGVSDDEMRRRYDAIDQALYDYDKDEGDFLATLGWFQEVRDFYQRAAAASRSVIFTVDQ